MSAVRKLLTFPGTITRKLTAKAQTTIPQPVRSALGLRALRATPLGRAAEADIERVLGRLRGRLGG